MATLATREAQVLAITEDVRENDNGNAENPILYAEAGPNRFASMSLFFPEEDGVRIDEDLDLEELTVTYFTDEGETILTAGAVYDWAVTYYRENY